MCYCITNEPPFGSTTGHTRFISFSILHILHYDSIVSTNFIIYVEIVITCNSALLASDNCVLDFSDTDNVAEDKWLCAKVVCVSVGDGISMCSAYSAVKCCIL